MFDFAHPHLLYLLFAVPFIGLLYWWARASRLVKLRRIGRLPILEPLMPMASRYKPWIKIILELLAVAMLVFVLARPRAGEVRQTSRTDGIEIMVAFDISNSMLASSTDDPKGVSRLQRAKLVLEKLISLLNNDKVGLVIFAGDAKLQLPMTTDFYTAQMYLNDLSPRLITYQGTAITAAIDMCVKSFSGSKDLHRAIILITDAEDHDGDAVEAAKKAAEDDIQVDVIGLGSSKGMPIPVANGQYLKDYEGQMVLTAFNDKIAKEIAAAGNGIYVNGASSDALDDLTRQLDTLQKSRLKSVDYTAGAEQFPVFAWIALGLLILDVFILDRKIGWLSRIEFFTKTKKNDKPQA